MIRSSEKWLANPYWVPMWIPHIGWSTDRACTTTRGFWILGRTDLPLSKAAALDSHFVKEQVQHDATYVIIRQHIIWFPYAVLTFHDSISSGLACQVLTLIKMQKLSPAGSIYIYSICFELLEDVYAPIWFFGYMYIISEILTPSAVAQRARYCLTTQNLNSTKIGLFT